METLISLHFQKNPPINVGKLTIIKKGNFICHVSLPNIACKSIVFIVNDEFAKHYELYVLPMKEMRN